MQRTLFAIPLLMFACGTQPPASEPEPEVEASAAVTLDAALAARGFLVQPGSFEFLDMTQCCETSCSGNNPSSPYATMFVPPAPGQTAPNPDTRDDGTASQWRLRADEALVFIGPTAPQAAYFGFTPYLMQRVAANGTPKSIFASLSETLNHLVIGTADGQPFASQTAVVVAADSVSANLATAALIESGTPQQAINLLVLDPAIGRFGLDASADTFGVLFRMALVSDPDAKAAYIANPGARVLRLTPNVARSLSALPSPVARPKPTSPTESALQSAVQKLGTAITKAYPGFSSQSPIVDDGVPDPEACIANLTSCAGDNRDTTYPGTNVRVVFSSPDDFYMVYGVDHHVSGKTVYSNASVYALDKLVGIASVASDVYPTSAQRYLSGNPDAAKLYAWKLARTCNGEPDCLEIPYGTCPDGMPDGALGTITFRTYLEPSSATAPLPSTLVRDHVMAFKKR
jgi:hypothetical protein